MDVRTIAEDRPLSEPERTLITWLLEHGSEESQTYVPQLDEVRVVSRCGCGCPSIDFLEPGSTQSRTVADFVGVTPEGLDVGIMLRAAEGKLSYLEVYCYGENDGPFSLPDISTLKPL